MDLLTNRITRRKNKRDGQTDKQQPRYIKPSGHMFSV
jgi:hypothetical protein